MICQHRGRRQFEAAICALLTVVLVAFVVQALAVGVRVPEAVGGLLPTLSTADSAVLAVGIVGATVMPHAIYLHSALTQDLGGADTSDHGRRRAARATRTDVLVALSIAGAVNAAILLGAASLEGHDVDTLTGAHRAFGELSGPLTATLFGVALLASSLAATSVGSTPGRSCCRGSRGGGSRCGSVGAPVWCPQSSCSRRVSMPRRPWC